MMKIRNSYQWIENKFEDFLWEFHFMIISVKQLVLLKLDL